VRKYALAITLLLFGLAPVSGLGQVRSDRAHSEQVRIRDRLEMLQDSLKVVVGRMETARKSVEAYSSELDELEKEIEALGEVPEALPLRARVLSLRRTLMVSGMGRPSNCATRNTGGASCPILKRSRAPAPAVRSSASARTWRSGSSRKSAAMSFLSVAG
jgi:hypothetical protein